MHISPPSQSNQPDPAAQNDELVVDDNGQLLPSAPAVSPIADDSQDSAVLAAAESLAAPSATPEVPEQSGPVEVHGVGEYTGQRPEFAGVNYLEQWKNTLAQYPVSQEYQDAHPGVTFTARTLAFMQQETESELDKIKPIEETLRSLPVNKTLYFSEVARQEETEFGVLGVPPTFEELMTELYGAENLNDQKWVELKGVWTDAATTLGDLKRLYVDLYYESRIAPKKSLLMSTWDILTDVNEGRASAHQSTHQ